MRSSDWSSDVCFPISRGYGERDKIVEDMVVADKVLSEKQVRWYGDKQSYNLWKNAMEVKGWENIQDYIVDPESLPPAEPNQLQKAELDEKLTNIEVAKRTHNIREDQAAGAARRKDATLLLNRHANIEIIQLKKAETPPKAT